MGYPDYGSPEYDRQHYERSDTNVLLSRTEWSGRHWLAIVLVLCVGAVITVGAVISVVIGGVVEEEHPGTIQHTQQVTPPPLSVYEILKQVPIIDGHNDWPWNIRSFIQNKLETVDLSQDLSKIEPWSTSPWSHTDIPRLRQGHVGAQFWAAYVPCESQHLNAVQLTLEQIDVIKRLTYKYTNHFKFVTSSQGIEEAFTEGRIASLIGVEGGHSIGNSLAVLRILYELGVRYMTLTHNCHTPWADSHIADRERLPVHNGLTEFGKLVVLEMNRLGMMVDLAHVALKTMIDAIDTSRAPVIFSHSSSFALCNSTRNVPDYILKKVASKGGIVMVTFFSTFISCSDTATLSQVADHIENIQRIAGADHVGLGGDFDGINRVPRGLENVSKYPDLLMELARRGWTEENLKKLSGLNFLRVFRKVEEIRDQMEMAGVHPREDLIPPQMLEGHTNCTYDFS